MNNKGQIKISSKLGDTTYYRKSKSNRKDVCKRCGSPLTTEKSKQVGFGHTCFQKVPAIIILEIQPADSQPLTAES